VVEKLSDVPGEIAAAEIHHHSGSEVDNCLNLRRNSAQACRRDSYLEWESEKVFNVYGPKGELKAEKELRTKGPELKAGENMVTFQCEAGEELRPRANVTVISYGPALVGTGK